LLGLALNCNSPTLVCPISASWIAITVGMTQHA
jgi:hypothetical protein